MAKRILAVASGGGHWVEMRRIMPAFEGYDVAYASIDPLSQADVVNCRYYTFSEFHRFKLKKFGSVVIAVFMIMKKERPKVVITTGSAPGLIALIIGKFVFGSKGIWIDSIANCECMSTSGRLAGWVADHWITQWPHIRREGGPDYWGSVI